MLAVHKDSHMPWPEKTVKMCQRELAEGKSVKEVRRMYGIPQGTLYRWKKSLRQPEAAEKHTKQQMKLPETDKRMAESAARGAMAAIELMERRITRSAAAERKRERLHKELEKMPDGEKRKQLEKRLKELEEPLSASSLTAIYKALSERSVQESVNIPVRIEVVLNKDGEEYAG